MTDRAGTRGGPVPPSADEAVSLLQTWRSEEFGWVRARIVQVARLRGEWHADDFAEAPISQPNVIGAAVRSLLQIGAIEPTGERRKAASAASHGRRSDVYRLADRGRIIASALERMVGSRLPAPRPAEQREMEQPRLFDAPAAPPRRPSHMDPEYV